jgi:hypothetical protein
MEAFFILTIVPVCSVALVNGSYLLERANGFGRWGVNPTPTAALASFTRKLLELHRAADSDCFGVAFDGPAGQSWRLQLSPDYLVHTNELDDQRCKALEACKALSLPA